MVEKVIRDHEVKGPPTMSLIEAEKIVRAGVNYDHIKVTQCYDIQYWVNIENEEKNKNPDLVQAKDIMLRALLEEQIRATGRFDFSGIKFEKTCPDCGGTGELYKLGRKSIEEACKKCVSNAAAIAFLGPRYDPLKMKISDKPEDADKSSGKRLVKCRKCENGRYIKGSHDGGLKINVLCKTCHGKAEVLIKCKTCRGKKIVKKNVLDGSVESTTTCKTCHDKGFLTPKEISKSYPDNPIIPVNLGEAIKDGTIPTELDSRLSQKQKQI